MMAMRLQTDSQSRRARYADKQTIDSQNSHAECDNRLRSVTSTGRSRGDDTAANARWANAEGDLGDHQKQGDG